MILPLISANDQESFYVIDATRSGTGALPYIIIEHIKKR